MFPSGLPIDHAFISLLDILRTLHPPGIFHPTYKQQAVQTMKLHTMQFLSILILLLPSHFHVRSLAVCSWEP